MLALRTTKLQNHLGTKCELVKAGVSQTGITQALGSLQDLLAQTRVLHVDMHGDRTEMRKEGIA